MVNVSIARRYAKALFEAAGASSDAVLGQLETFVSALTTSDELADIVNNPAYTVSQRRAVVEKLIAAAGEVAPALASTLLLLTERGRFGSLPDITRIYRDLVDARVGRIRGRITSAKKLDAAAVASMEKALEHATQHKVVLETREDPSLIGGVSAQLGSQTYDGSVKAQLAELKKRLSV